ncbi:unnamed protein product [Rhizoctonia solani]|uniref:NACHT domain-containing protein n=1 Tax=Rhizoctonia solani TaxID=456999 RepID=A0A8H3HU02_9AGAM|nr:unnamed protein product [Rhizoctonia solani]
MAWKRILKRDKKERPESESRGGQPGADTPSPSNSVQSTSSTPRPSVAVSALVFQPFAPLISPASPPVEHRMVIPTSNDTWTNLTAFLNLLNEAPLFAPVAEAIDDLSWCVRLHEDILATRNEYTALRTQLEGLFKDLRTHFSGSTPTAMTTSMLNLCEAIQAEIRELHGTQDRNVISRYMRADQDLEKIMRCYRRIQGHLERVMLNASLNIWKSTDEHTTEARLAKLNPSMSACYDSAEAGVTQRRECVARTREKVLLDLNAWKNDQDGEKVCWINGMAGTGKTTIANTLCSTLDRNHQLGASFFCTRLIPACRDVKLILPTIAYQLSRFSDPFRGALLKVLQRDPDVYTKVPRVQFKRMILDPLQEVQKSLPIGTVVVIDALDECEDASGVERILEVLLEDASKLPVKFLVSSRPEYHIRERVRQFTLKQLMLHELDDSIVKADIATYLEAELTSISVPLTYNQLSVLVERAGALFIYAATVVRYIRGGDSSERLDTFLKASGAGQGPSTKKTKEIDRLYETVLVSALNGEDLEESEKQRIELVLHTVVCAQEPLTVDALAGILRLRRTQVLTALRPLWSVLHVSESDSAHRVSTLHASFPDYILDSKRSLRFACDAQSYHGHLAKLCFWRIGGNRCQFNICNLQSSYVLDEYVPNIEDKVQQAIPLDLLYACQHWATHLSLSGISNERVEAMHDFLSKRLLLWMEVLNLKKRIDRGMVQMEKAIAWLQTNKCSLNHLSLAQDARGFLTMFATSPVSRSTPHLYISMLSSWPHQQPTSHYFARQTIKSIQIKGMKSVERQLGLLSLIPVGLGAEVRCVAYASSGRFFAAGTADGRLLIWDAMSCRMTIDPIKAHNDWARAIAISPDGTRICSGSHDKTLCIWDPQNGQLVAGPLRGHNDRIWSVDYSPDGRWLASGSLDGTVCIWSTDNWQQKSKPFIEPGGRVFSVAFSPDCSIIATGFESLIHLRDPFNGHEVCKPLKGHTEDIESLAFMPDGKHLISGSDDRTICIWGVNTGQLVSGPFQEHLDAVYSVAVSPDGRLFVSAGLDDAIRIWDTKTWQSRSVIRNTGIVRSVKFSPDGSHIVSGSMDGNIRIWEAQGVIMGHVADHQSDGHSSWVTSVAFSPCGTYLVSGSKDMTVCIWNLQTKQLMCGPLKGHNDWVLSVGVTADGNHAFSISGDRMIYVWGGRTGELNYKIGPVETDGNYGLDYQENWPAAFIADSKQVVCGSKSGRIYMWEDNKLAFSLTGHDNKITSIAFSPDGNLFASGSKDGVLAVWDARTRGRLFDPFTGHSARIFSIAFSPDGTQIASDGGGTTIRLWSSLTGAPMGNPLQGHTETIRSVVFSPSGNQLASGSEDMSVRVWDVAGGHSIAVFQGHTDMVLSVAFSPDGAQVASGSADMAIRFWDIPSPTGTLPQNYVGYEHSGREATDDTEDNAAFHTEMGTDGWVRDAQGRLLLWVPPDIRSVLLQRQNPALISRQGRIELDFFGAKIGDGWETCYEPL